MKSHASSHLESQVDFKPPRLRRTLRFLMLVTMVIIVGYSCMPKENHIISMTDEELSKYRKVNDIKELKFSERDISSKFDAVFQIGCRDIDTSQPRANATLVMLARNNEVDDVIKSMISMERHFNQWFNYPWVFLNDEPFDDNFKVTVAQYTKSVVEFGQIPKEHWEFPDNVDKDEFKEFTQYQGDRRILYGNNPSYHKMCRFFSKTFFNHPLVAQREWYWRVEPDVEFFCDLTYDPFVEMEKSGKKYGFTIALHELYYTVPGLFREAKTFAMNNQIKPNKLWRMLVKNFKYSQGNHHQDYDLIKDRKDILREIELELTIDRILQSKPQDVSNFNPEILGKIIRRSTEPPILHLDRMDYEEYNLCHFWTNFEIAKTEIFQSQRYKDFVYQLEQSGGFYKERWGDAPVHSLALSMIVDIDDIHYFRDIGYKHSTIGHCPSNSKLNQLPYEPSADNVNNKNFKLYKPDSSGINGVGCRCKCPLWHKEIEDSSASCIQQWHRVTRDDYTPYVPIDLDYFRQKIARKLDRFLKKGGKLGDNNVVENM